MSIEKGVWLWDDPDHGGYTHFDEPTSTQIEGCLQQAIKDKLDNKTEVLLSAGPWFSREKNKGVYAAVMIVNCTDPKNPYIKEASQRNTKTGYKRPIKRDPPLIPPLSKEHDEIIKRLAAKWEWKDDSGWKEYELVTMEEIENAFQENRPMVYLSTGPWFSKPQNKENYYLDINYLSVPASAQQQNKKTHFGRWARRIPIAQKIADKKRQQIMEFFIKADPLFLLRKDFFPLSLADFRDQTKLSCSICSDPCDEKQNLEQQVNGLKAIKTPSAQINGHQEDLSQYRKHVKNRTVVGLNKCKYGHYYHADCITKWFHEKTECPNCKTQYGTITGNQPDGRLYFATAKQKCKGNESVATIKMLFEFPGGVQNASHPHEGKIYFGDLREAYLPNTEEGRRAAMWTRIAFRRKLIFTIGESLTLKQDDRIIFASLHLKTNTRGGQDKHGWPDDTYFKRFKDELNAKGVTDADLSAEELEFIQHGHEMYNEKKK